MKYTRAPSGVTTLIREDIFWLSIERAIENNILKEEGGLMQKICPTRTGSEEELTSGSMLRRQLVIVSSEESVMSIRNTSPLACAEGQTLSAASTMKCTARVVSSAVNAAVSILRTKTCTSNRPWQSRAPGSCMKPVLTCARAIDAPVVTESRWVSKPPALAGKVHHGDSIASRLDSPAHAISR
jgi:hypothetical protein